jgi:acetoin utilization protein AcuB
LPERFTAEKKVYICETRIRATGGTAQQKMTANDLITDDIPPLRIDDTAEKALRWMDEFRVSNLAVVNGTEFVGIISDTILLDFNDPDAPIGSQRLSLVRPVLQGTQHVYDALKLMAELNLDVIAVTDANGHYSGTISIQRLAERMASLAAVREPGGILELEVNSVDYSLSQIAQIVEGNDAKILSVYLSPTPEPSKIQVTLKINREDLTRILQTFARYNYTVLATHHQSEFTEDLKHRYDEFMNFINM